MSRHRSAARLAGAALALAICGAATGAEAQDAGAAFDWTNQTELSFVATGGNSSATSLGLKGLLEGTKDGSTLKFEAGGIRAETHTTTRAAVGTASDFDLTETTTSQLTAESYFARARFDRTLGEVFLFGGGGWDRNTFAGVQNRYALVAGVGRAWVEGEGRKLKTDIGATYTIQKDVDPAPDADESFAGLRVTIDAMRALSPSADLSSTLVVDDNLENTDDLRADWVNALTVSVTEGLALKTSLQLLWDNQPSLLSVPLTSPTGAPAGSVLTPGDKVDSVFTVTLVIKL